MPEHAEIEAVARALLEAWSGPIPHGRDRFATMAERAIVVLDAVRDAHGPEPDALGGLPPSQPKEDDERRH
jgi:hypothetical protein